jgi:hypothetical protein
MDSVARPSGPWPWRGAPGIAARQTAGGSCFIFADGILGDTPMPGAGTGLTVSAGAIDDFGTLTAGTAAVRVGHLILSGNLIEEAGALINDWGLLTFTTGGNSGAHADLQGTLTLSADGLGVAGVVNASEPLWMDGSTLLSTGGTPMAANTISGDVDVYNDGTMNLGTTTAPASVLSLTGGSLTIGAQVAGLSPTGGTLTLNMGSDLIFPAATGVTSTFEVSGGTAPATVNLNGAAITMAVARVASMDLEGGVLNTDSTSGGAADTITGSLTNNGTVSFGGTALHTLFVTGTYTQESGGTLDVRLANGSGAPGSIAPSDVLAIGGNATLDGTLDVSALSGSLNPTQTWQPVAYGSNVPLTDFSTVNFPADGNLFWTEAAGAANVTVGN